MKCTFIPLLTITLLDSDYYYYYRLLYDCKLLINVNHTVKTYFTIPSQLLVSSNLLNQ